MQLIAETWRQLRGKSGVNKIDFHSFHKLKLNVSSPRLILQVDSTTELCCFEKLAAEASMY